MFGGRGGITGTVIGALIIAMLVTGLVLLGVDPFWQFIVIGIVVILAVLIDQARDLIVGRAESAVMTALAAASVVATDDRAPAPMLSVRHMVKRFGGLTAVDDVSLDVMRGEVVGLVGDNGAGKSTLIKCVSGVHQADEGTSSLDGQTVRFSRPLEARRAGIETIYQDLALAGQPRRERQHLPGPRDGSGTWAASSRPSTRRACCASRARSSTRSASASRGSRPRSRSSRAASARPSRSRARSTGTRA